jgi:ATP-dependent Clp protease protease subunit
MTNTYSPEVAAGIPASADFVRSIQARYILPQFIEHTPNGQRQYDPYAKLFEERIVFVGTPIDQTVANDVMAQLLVLESQDPDRDITMYINSPGGSVPDMLAIYDTMQYVHCDIVTVCHPAGRRHPRQACRAAERHHPDPPAAHRRGIPGAGVGSGDPGRRDRAHP